MLHLLGKKCVCILHRLGEVAADRLAGVEVPAVEPSRCFVAMEVGEAFVVRPDPDALASASTRSVIRPR